MHHGHLVIMNGKTRFNVRDDDDHVMVSATSIINAPETLPCHVP
jgi:hypothetical protein